MSDTFDYEFDPEDFEDWQGDYFGDDSVGRWTTKQGDCLRICNMEDSHILNCINFLQRNYSKNRSAVIERKLQEFKIEICFRDYCKRNKGTLPGKFKIETAEDALSYFFKGCKK